MTDRVKRALGGLMILLALLSGGFTTSFARVHTPRAAGAENCVSHQHMQVAIPSSRHNIQIPCQPDGYFRMHAMGCVGCIDVTIVRAVTSETTLVEPGGSKCFAAVLVLADGRTVVPTKPPPRF